jgi:hypothetical protein
LRQFWAWNHQRTLGVNLETSDLWPWNRAIHWHSIFPSYIQIKIQICIFGRWRNVSTTKSYNFHKFYGRFQIIIKFEVIVKKICINYKICSKSLIFFIVCVNRNEEQYCGWKSSMSPKLAISTTSYSKC